MFAVDIRRKRVGGKEASRWRWHFDDLSVKLNGIPHDLWRAVDHGGEVLEALASRDAARRGPVSLRWVKRTC